MTSPVQTLQPAPGFPAWRGEFKALSALAWPLVLAQLAQISLFTTDVLMISWLGEKHLAAAALATSFLTPFLLTGLGLISAVASLVAQTRGRGDETSVRHIVQQGLWAAIIASILFIAIVWQIEPIFAFLRQDPELTALARDYIHVAVWLFVPALLLTVLRSMLSAFGDTRIVFAITLASVVVNAALNYVFIFGTFGFPALGLQGSALATVITNALMLLGYVGYVSKRYGAYHLLTRFWQPHWTALREIFRVGTPIGLTVLAEVSLFSVAALMMGWLGTSEVAAHAVALQLASIAFTVPTGIGQAATVRVGLAFGRKDKEAVRKAGWVSIAMGVSFMASACLLFLLLPAQLIGLFLNPNNPANAVSFSLAASYLAVAALFQLVDGAQVVAAYSLRGLSDTKTPMIIAIIGYWAVGMPVAYGLGFGAGLRGVGIWLGLAAGLAFAAVALCLRFAWRERLKLLEGLR